ncbi:hypothetical protein [Klebsiella phage KpF5]|nr:hypothetical protein [Klebsiella phage KpF5]
MRISESVVHNHKNTSFISHKSRLCGIFLTADKH